ncbi:cyclopropane-fatty-acyl-phospholipid synthase family protein [Paraburkholderia sp. MMS20-SJTR3]|uniref:Cyclopropane-fatty-acyl-phospholipid synthase family protein n=1 Tax=Paraburkholderia sejongensis TaxID=2886946 RepID=A0ABS8JMG6_9BURK|nr:cyclopropane-fatty-acyl-phospholipid synthase family protein [Paraburkholderia sp. MMS20-SJTR3]MCC8391098.1 cyclopropane-fatty-acyl-phospholipid synthase family protein [Paraburkholderia sp. MMS20-SJTR3]
MSTTLTDPSAAAPIDDHWIIRCCERGWLPDALIRAGMRRLIRARLRDEHADDGEALAEALERLLADLRASPIAVETGAANTQHYEVPARFFEAHLGPHLKYSCGYYPRGSETLAEAEVAMLERYVERAGLSDAQRILDLGCGWGSLALWLAQRFPRAQIVALSNAQGQRRFIEECAARRGLKNLRVLTGNIADFDFPQHDAGFDRIVSIEMFEHMKNYGLLLGKLSRWLRDDGRLFVHMFAHRSLAYQFASSDATDWMSRHFFTGGTMPSAALLLRFQDDLRVNRQWWLDGTHYARTAEQWLAALDAARAQILPILADVYGKDTQLWFQRWRMFYMAVAELFGYARGSEWGVAHYLFEKREPGNRRDRCDAHGTRAAR